ncbi:MAG: DUF2779 domain-containing protein [Erysipelotrichaceae bacterium]|nr:DUF2779 domain-containing protein [Erysipelotrichaceae bacterium]
MYHISDVKKYTRCARLYINEKHAPKREYQPFIRLDEEVTSLVAQKLHIEDHYFLGHKGDDPSAAKQAMKSAEWLMKARFEYRQLRVKVPFLHQTDKGWDLYFLFIGLYPHADDMQFYCDEVWVLENNHIKIDQIYIIHLNAEYIREEELDPSALFVISDCFYNGKNHPSVKVKDAIYKSKRDLTHVLNEMDQLQEDSVPAANRTNHCTTRQKCRYYDSCFPNEAKEPDDSILTLVASQNKHEMKKEGIALLKDADSERIEGSRQQYAQILADQEGGLHVDRYALKSWLSWIKYPISFLDFEWERFAIPPYKGMRPYDVMPFEYSLHIMQADGTMTHKVYLNIHDDRRDMAKNLVTDIPAQGTVIAYNAVGAEMMRIAEFAQLFPEYAAKLNDINARMEDLQLIFETGTVYDIRMRGQWSLKVIMAMMNDKSYKDLDINQGMEAVFQWRHLDYSDDTADHNKIVEDLKKYCGMDSYAMTVVFQWLKKINEEKMQ